MKAYELEVHFIGDPEYYYFTSRAEAEAAANELNEQPAEAAYFGEAETRATINEINLEGNRYIECNSIITVHRVAL